METKTIILSSIAVAVIILTITSADAADHLIGSEEDLKKIGTGDFGLGDSYRLTEDITIKDKVWNSIGNSSCPFTGNFDGNGKIIAFSSDVRLINGKTAETTESDGYGLFGNIENAQIEDIYLVICNMTTEIPLKKSSFEMKPTGPLAGVVAGEETKIRNCRVYKAHTEAGIINSNTGTGGLIGLVEAGWIDNCTSQADVAANGAAGGLIGITKNMTMSNSVAEGDIVAETAAGGAIGTVSGASTVVNVYAEGDVVAFENKAGTFIGDIIAPGSMFLYCKADGILKIISEWLDIDLQN